MNNQDWESGEKMSDNSVRKEPFGLKIAFSIIDILVALGAVVIMIAAQFVAVITFMIFDANPDVLDGSQSFLYVVIAIPALLIYLRLVKPKDRPMFMNGKLNVVQIIFCCVIALGLMGIVTLYLVIAGFIAEQFTTVAGELDKYSDAVDRYSAVTPAEIPAFDHILNFIAVCFLVPVTEELTFRAGILHTLLKRFPPIVAILVSGGIFGLLHGFSIQIGYALIAGFFLGWVYYYTKSIKSTILIHVLFNLFGSGIYTLMESGLFGDLTEIGNTFNTYSMLVEFSFIIPSIICFLCLRAMYKDSIKINTLNAAASEPSGEYDPDPVASFEPDKDAPSPFAPVKEETDNEQA